MARKAILSLLAVVLLAVVALWQRHRILIPLATTGAPIPPVTDAPTVPGGQPFGSDEHFWVVALDASTYAIAEPYSWARNVNYLIVGEQRALLFDAGVGHYDIRPVVASLTDLPLTFMPSHFHYDHTGQGEWGHIALVDLPHLRERAIGNTLTPAWGEHLGDGEAIERPVWEVTEWVEPNTFIDLGGRRLQLLYTPGHTNNSVSLYEAARDLMFTGDFLTNSGSMSAFLPSANLGDFLQSSTRVLARTQNRDATVFRGAHAPPANTVPFNDREDLRRLRERLRAIRDGDLTGTGVYPTVYVIEEGWLFSVEPGFLQDWTPTYPDDHAVHGSAG